MMRLTCALVAGPPWIKVAEPNSGTGVPAGTVATPACTCAVYSTPTTMGAALIPVSLAVLLSAVAPSAFAVTSTQ